MFGRSAEISRDEYRFKKFLDRLRNRFVLVVEDILKTQLLLKNIIVDSDWESIKKQMYWSFNEDNNFVQWKEAEVLNSRLESMAAVDPFVGKYFTRMWVMNNIMRLGPDEAEKMIEDADNEQKLSTPDMSEEETSEIDPSEDLEGSDTSDESITDKEEK